MCSSLRHAACFWFVICSWSVVAAADEGKIAAALAKPVDVQFDQTPLRDAVEFLATLAGVPITLDAAELARAEIPLDSPVTRSLRQHPLRSSLSILLRPLNLTCVELEDELLVTTRERERESLRLRVISVESWVRPADEDSDLLQRELIEYLYLAGHREPGWRRNGGVGGLRMTTAGEVALSTTPHTLWQIDQLLQALQAAREATAAPPAQFRPVVIPTNPLAPRIVRLLDEPLDVDFAEATWADVADFLEARCNLPVVANKEEMPATVTFRSRGRSIRRTLDQLARSAGLAWHVADDALQFTPLEPNDPPERALSIRLYCVADLAPGDDRDAVRDALDDLQELVLALTANDAPGWEQGGGAGAVLPLSVVKALAVSTTDEAHGQIERLLSELRRERAAKPAAAPAKKPLATRRYSVVTPGGADEAKLRKRVAWIRATIAPETWDRDGYRLEIVEDEVIVTHRTDVHRRIELLMPPFGSAAWYRAGGVF